MRKKTLFFLPALILLTSQRAYASSSLDLLFYSYRNSPITVEIFKMPFSPSNEAITEKTTTYNSHFDKQEANFINLPSSKYYYFAFQPMRKNDKYTPLTDLSVFSDNSGNGFDSNDPDLPIQVLEPPSKGNNVLEATQNSDGSISLLIEDNSQKTNFLRYSKNNLNIEFITQDKNTFEFNLDMDSTCTNYFCGKINSKATLDPQNYDISINNGLSSLVYIKNALKLIPPPKIPISFSGIKVPPSPQQTQTPSSSTKTQKQIQKEILGTDIENNYQAKSIHKHKLTFLERIKYFIKALILDIYAGIKSFI